MRLIFTIYFFITISANQNEEIMCKARPGCQLAKCDPGLPSSLSTNEYPITCVKNSVQDKALKAENDELKRKLENLLTEWEEMKPILSELKRKAAAEDDCRRREGLVHSGKCFNIPSLSSSWYMNYDQAVAECAKYGALLAEIHDRAQQAALNRLVLSKLPAGTSYADLRMGMEYKPATSTLLYRSGKELEFSRFVWHPGRSAKYGTVVMRVRLDDDSNQGLFDTSKSSGRHGVICEKDI